MIKFFFLSSLFIFLLGKSGICQSSGSLSSMAGIWENTFNTDTEKAYIIVYKQKVLNFVYSPQHNAVDFPLNESIHGFQHIDSGNYETLEISLLEDSGKFYTIIDRTGIAHDSTVVRPYYVTPKEFNCDGNNMSIYGAGKLAEYYKLSAIPHEVLSVLYMRGSAESRDYILEYLGMKVLRVKKTFKIPESKGETLISRLQIVQILKQKKGRYFIRTFNEPPIVGWVDEDLLEKR